MEFSASVPFHALRRIFEDNALRLQLVADAVGFGEILRLARRLTLLNEVFNFAVEVVRLAVVKQSHHAGQ